NHARRHSDLTIGWNDRVEHGPRAAVPAGVVSPSSVDNEPAGLRRSRSRGREDATDAWVAIAEDFVLRLIREHAGEPGHGAQNRCDPGRRRTAARDFGQHVALGLEIGFVAAVPRW